MFTGSPIYIGTREPVIIKKTYLSLQLLLPNTIICFVTISPISHRIPDSIYPMDFYILVKYLGPQAWKIVPLLG